MTEATCRGFQIKGEIVEDISLKLMQEDIDFVQEMIDNPPAPNEELVAAYKAYNTSKNDDGSFNI